MLRNEFASKTSGLVGVVNPTVLDHAAELSLFACPVLEIRYDLFPSKKIWPELVSRVKALAPKARIIATIRMECDGGRWPTADANLREPFWYAILGAAQIPDWIDIEWGELESHAELMAFAQDKQVKVLASQHDFQGIPDKETLQKAVALAEYWRADGFKIAGMSSVVGDCEGLYALAREHGARFTWFSAFAMGTTGMASRLFSFVCGANLSYGSLGQAVAPGQIPMGVMFNLVSKLNAKSTESEVLEWLRAEGLVP